MISTWMHFTPVTLCPGFAGIESQNKFSLQESCVFEKAEAPALLRRKLIRHFVLACSQPWYVDLHRNQGLEQF